MQPLFPSVQAELAAEMSSANMSALWNGSWHSVADRIRPSGFLPTSVSGGCENAATQPLPVIVRCTSTAMMELSDVPTARCPLPNPRAGLCNPLVSPLSSQNVLHAQMVALSPLSSQTIHHTQMAALSPNLSEMPAGNLSVSWSWVPNSTGSRPGPSASC